MAEKVIMVNSEAEARAQLAAEMAELAKNPPSRSVPGGRYRVGGVLVNAEGKPLGKAKASDDEGEAPAAPAKSAAKSGRK